MSETCTKCGDRPRTDTHRWCKECQTAARRRIRFGVGDVQRADQLVVVSNADVQREDRHCAACKYPAGEFEPPIDERGWRILGQDPRGWAEGHGPENPKPCCVQFTCYDMRPGHRAWP